MKTSVPNTLRISCKVLDITQDYAILENKDKVWWLGGPTFKWPKPYDIKVGDSIVITLKEIDYEPKTGKKTS
jgi:hypothetical protein